MSFAGDTPPRTAVFVGQGHNTEAPPPCPHCDHAPSDPSAAATPVVLDLDPVRAAAASLETFVVGYDSLLDSYQSALRDLTAARRHNEELHVLLQPLSNSLSVARTYRKGAFVSRSSGRPMRSMMRYTVLEESTTEAYYKLQDHAASLERLLAGGAPPEETTTSTLAQDLIEARGEALRLLQLSTDFEGQAQSAEKRRLDAVNARDQARRVRASYEERVREPQHQVSILQEDNRQLRDDVRRASAGVAGLRRGETVDGLRFEICTRDGRIRSLESDLARIRRRRDEACRAQENAIQRHVAAAPAIGDTLAITSDSDNRLVPPVTFENGVLVSNAIPCQISSSNVTDIAMNVIAELPNNTAIQRDSLISFHERFGHLVLDTVERIANRPHSGIEITDHTRKICLTCTKGKQRSIVRTARQLRKCADRCGWWGGLQRLNPPATAVIPI